MLSWQAAGLTEGFFPRHSSQPVSQRVTLLFFFTEKKKRSKKRKEFAFHLFYKIQVSPEDYTLSSVEKQADLSPATGRK
ncbi:MAG: hypothetical protein MSH13_02765 [Ruminococcus callidus]|nr:hypothetical protein [Ruminococcus callidus]